METTHAVGHYPECLEPEIARLAQELYERRLDEGRALDPVADWLQAEELVTAAHRASPARFLPGGDLFPF